MTQKSLIFSFLSAYPYYTAGDLHILFPDVPQPSIRRIRAELKKEGLY